MTAQDTAHRRRSIRLQCYDYSRAGAYFVTICTQDRDCLFGEILDGELKLNEAGRRIAEAWQSLPDHYPTVQVDAAVVMPNHFHGLVILREPGAGSKAFAIGFGASIQIGNDKNLRGRGGGLVGLRIVADSGNGASTSASSAVLKK